MLPGQAEDGERAQLDAFGWHDSVEAIRSDKVELRRLLNTRVTLRGI